MKALALIVLLATAARADVQYCRLDFGGALPETLTQVRQCHRLEGQIFRRLRRLCDKYPGPTSASAFCATTLHGTRTHGELGKGMPAPCRCRRSPSAVPRASRCSGPRGRRSAHHPPPARNAAGQSLVSVRAASAASQLSPRAPEEGLLLHASCAREGPA